VTNGDVRLSPTPEQWDATPTLIKRDVDKANNTISVRLGYPDHQFEYTLKVQPSISGVSIKVILDKPLPAAMVGKAGFNLEFLPSAYFGKSYYMDDRTATLPLYPSGPTQRSSTGDTERLPLADG
jgi:endoglucanase